MCEIEKVIFKNCNLIEKKTDLQIKFLNIILKNTTSLKIIKIINCKYLEKVLYKFKKFPEDNKIQLIIENTNM